MTFLKGNHAHKGHFKNNPIGESTGRSRAQKIFPCPKGSDRHHIDGDEFNNDPNNIQILSHKKHGSVSAKTRVSSWNKGKHWSEKHKQKVSAKLKGKIPWNKGLHR